MIQWFREHKRKMPWREDPTPYHVWTSEIMLQQTRVDTVRPYYDRFIRELPDIRALAECPEEKLLKLWEGLGYYSRVRNFQKAARKVMTDFSGRIPSEKKELMSLPGVGSYTAGAVASIAFGKPEPVVDGNVLRVFSRLFLWEKSIKDPETKARFEKESEEFLRESGTDPSAWNQGLMELGALICLPKAKPDCGACPLKEHCGAFRTGRTRELPVNPPKKSVKSEKKTVFIIRKEGKIALVRQEEKGLLQGMYGYPSEQGHLTEKKVREYFRSRFSEEPVSIEGLPEKKHVFSHVEWLMKAFLIEGKGEYPFLFASEKDIIEKFPVAAAYKKWEIPFGGSRGEKK